MQKVEEREKQLVTEKTNQMSKFKNEILTIKDKYEGKYRELQTKVKSKLFILLLL